MWLLRIERRLVAVLFTLWLAIERLHDFFAKVGAIWTFDAEGDAPNEAPQLGWDGAPAAPTAATPPAKPAPQLGWGGAPAAGGSPGNAARAVRSPQRTFVLEHKIAAGDLCDVHRSVSEGETFLIKTPRIGGGAANALIEKEWRALWSLAGPNADEHHSLYFPRPVESFLREDDGRRCNVLKWEDGFYTAGEIATRHPAGLDGRHLAWMFKRILAALGYVHRQGWVHGAVLPPHLLFHAENHGLHLAGWIHAVSAGQGLTLVPAPFKAWYPPEAKWAAGPATDIYLAARSLLYLAGGDPLRGTAPEHVPRPMRLFLESCLIESARMRPADAWELHDQFDDLLLTLYGPPQYVRLDMT
jgi:hypothetical protein